ncbi:hypothetical protein PT974_09302 [Cladobotryum mycophilum]|uniref:Uncharacterized protein n=1 Tax=Cladobotryum mycophilum TaxID=491253 RepID=A0ABR0SH64_9HYPO
MKKRPLGGFITQFLSLLRRRRQQAKWLLDPQARGDVSADEDLEVKWQCNIWIPLFVW